ncbi:MAG TPA: DUF5615 family PIN-like protein [Thermoleophilia bacterium]|nr:DUF5615 family PIN-like protein [Thermoleophilia bacterium]
MHVRDCGLQAATDDKVLAQAEAEERVLVTAGTDFAALLARAGTDRPSVIIFRRGSERRPERQAQLLLVNLPLVEEDLAAGSLVVLEEARIPIRSLPIPGSSD